MADTKDIRLLVADDDTTTLMIYERTLDGGSGSPLKRAYDVVICQQAEEAVRAVEQSIANDQPFAVAFLDVLMPPGPDGVWAAEQIRALDPMLNIVLVTSMKDVSPEKIALSIPPPDKMLYVQKPLDPLEMRSLVEAFGGKWRAERLVAEYQRDLEQKVEHRTEELARVNVELELDIKERRRVEKALRRSESGLARAQHMARLGFWESDLDGLKLTCSDEMVRLLGVDTHEAPKTAQELFGFIEDEGMSELHDLLTQTKIAGASLGVDHRLQPGVGPELIVHHAVEVVSDRKGRPDGLRGTLQDITELRRSEELIAYQAYHDMLTGLPNRRLFHDRLQIAMANARRAGTRIAVLFLDLDDFKKVNDSRGHAVGDKLLKAVADRLGDSVREENTIARVGGDEFLALIQGVSTPGNAVRAAERLMQALAAPFDVDGHELYLGASIGITIYPDDGATAEVLISNADIAMYRAKTRGHNSYKLFTPAMNIMVMERVALEASMRQAIKNKEFVLHYQPLIDLASGRTVGVEALIRWLNPEEGLVEPDAFIPLAEETGLIAPIGEWVLRQACTTVKSWHDLGHDELLVSVNLSPRQFQNAGLVSLIENVLEESGLAPRFLVLEITENAVMNNVEEAKRTMEELTNLGVSLAMDDFGRGYSSLSHLREFPVQALKIDRTFVADVTDLEESGTLVKSIIAMGQSLRLKVIAEGVENQQQLDFLRQHACDQIQGFYLGPPIPADEFLMSFDKS